MKDKLEDHLYLKKESLRHPKTKLVKFPSNDDVETFVRRGIGDQTILYKLKDFWCSGNQVPAKRANSKRHLEFAIIGTKTLRGGHQESRLLSPHMPTEARAGGRICDCKAL